MRNAYLAFSLVAISSFIPCSYANDVDNTSINARDRSGYNLTAQDQSNQKSFVKTTARLRRQIMRTKGLSVNAQNIKIIDRDGCVVLRGPVNTEQEKTTIDSLARQCCGQNIANELEVKTP